MKTSIKIIISIVIVCSLCQGTSFGCSVGIPPITKFDTEQYVFIGEVIDVVVSSKTEAWGLRVKVGDKVYLPLSPANYFEVFPYHLTAWCSLSGWSRAELLMSYPVGSQIRVIAKESTLLESKLPGGNIRLETSIYNRGSIARNTGPDLITSAESVYDYEKYVYRQRISAYADTLFDSNSYLPDFELRKDMLRLKEAASEVERISILERLLFFPRFYDIDYPKIARLYVCDAEILKRLDDRWEALKQVKYDLYRK